MVTRRLTMAGTAIAVMVPAGVAGVQPLADGAHRLLGCQRFNLTFRTAA